MEKKTILKVLVGSRAHGLATPESDSDYRGVFVLPTSQILSLGNNLKHTSWIEGDTDDTAWELGHFLTMATKSNPTVLETFLAPVVESTPEGDELRRLFPYVWNSKDVRNAFMGYALNQRKKLLDEKDGKPHKFAVAYLRTLHQAVELLLTGTFIVNIGNTDIGDTLKKWKVGNYSIGEVIELTREWEKKVEESYQMNPYKETDVEKINEFLLRVRKENW